MLSRRGALGGLLAGLAAPLAACGSPTPDQPLRLMVPNAPGGGYDTTARLLAGAVAESGGRTIDVFNLPGGSGTAGLGRLAREGDRMLMMMGLGVVGAAAVDDRTDALAAATPVARLLGEPDLVLVRSDSRFAQLDDLATAWARRPDRVVVGGGSRAGGPDHLATYSLADALGLSTARVRYRTYDGGGPLLAALLAGRIDVVMSGVLESMEQVRSGAVRALAVLGPQPVPGLEAPTVAELGVDLEFENWRGLLAPPGIGASTRGELVDLVAAAVGTTLWERAVDENGWTPRWLAGDDFAAFLAREQRRTSRLLHRLAGRR